MALVNLKKIKFVPLLCALVILVSCLPVLPAAAADDYTVSGFWQLNAQPIRVASNFYEDVIFHCAGVEYQKIGIFPGSIYYYTTSDLASGTNVSTLSSAVLTIKADYRLIYFPEPQAVSETFYDWLQDNAEPVAQTFVLDGVWRFDLTIVPSDFYVEQVFTCSNDSVEYSAMYFDGSNLIYDGSSAGFVAWSPETGWASSSYRTVLFQDESSVSEDIWSWLHCNAYQIRDPASDAYPVTSVVFSGTGASFQFTQEEFLSPDVLLSVTSTGAVLSSGSYRVKTWTYTGEGYFAGLNDDSSGQLLFPGNSILLPGLDGDDVSYRFTPAFTTDPVDPDPDPTHPTDPEAPDPVTNYTTTVNIYDAAGSSVLHTVSFTGSGVAPLPVMSVSAKGCTISYGDQSSSWELSSGSFYGFSLDPDASAIYLPGQSYTLLGGYAADVQMNLYVAAESEDGFITVIVIGDDMFEFTGSDGYPSVSLVMGSNGIAMYSMEDIPPWSTNPDPGLVTKRWTASPPWGASFAGFSLSADSDLVSLPVWDDESMPQSISFQGSDENNVLFLYPVYTLSGSVPPDVSGPMGGDPYGIRQILTNFFGIFVEPVSVFFSAEFIPGFSLGRLLLFSLVLALLAFLLKISS